MTLVSAVSAAEIPEDPMCNIYLYFYLAPTRRVNGRTNMSLGKFRYENGQNYYSGLMTVRVGGDAGYHIFTIFTCHRRGVHGMELQGVLYYLPTNSGPLFSQLIFSCGNLVENLGRMQTFDHFLSGTKSG